MNLKPLKVDQFAAETRVKMMTEMVEWLAGMGFTHLATFNFNAKATPTSIRTALKRFQWRMDRKLYGRSFHLLDHQKRTFFVGFIEHLHSNTHCHALLRSPSPEFDALASDLWLKIVPSGQLYLQGTPSVEDLFLSEMGMSPPRTLNVGDIRRIAKYITKEAHLPRQNEIFVLSTEFSPH